MCKGTRNYALSTKEAMVSKKRKRKKKVISLRELTETAQIKYNDNHGKRTRCSETTCYGHLKFLKVTS